MLSHIKYLFRQRKERQQKNFFINHFRNHKQSSSKEMQVKTYPANEQNLPLKTVFQSERRVEPMIRKKRSSDDMTITDQVVEEDNNKTSLDADELANLLVKQDNKRRSQLPSYPGLERFEIIRKLGEYVVLLFM